jgi:hypothetical protein
MLILIDHTQEEQQLCHQSKDFSCVGVSKDTQINFLGVFSLLSCMAYYESLSSLGLGLGFTLGQNGPLKSLKVLIGPLICFFASCFGFTLGWFEATTQVNEKI